MRQRIEPGAVLDGYVVGESIHKGGTGYVFSATPPASADPGFPIVIKAPGIGPGQPTIGIESYEMEEMILPALSGRHVPRFVAAGDLASTPYLAMEWVAGTPLAASVERAPLPPAEVAAVGAALADAVHSVHLQDVIHFDLKPENFILRPNGEAVLIDFGFARHAHYPDLLAEEQHYAAGSAAYVSPEQLQGDRTDPRSDLFALGVLLYELATGELPFGEPATYAGMRDRLWREPPPPRAVNAAVPPCLQEVILHCLEPDAALRYQSAAHVAFDLRHPEQVTLTRRAELTKGVGWTQHVERWWRARGSLGLPDAAQRRARAAPVIMVAVDTVHPEDRRHAALQRTMREILSLNREFRLLCVTVIAAAPLGEGRSGIETASGLHLEHKMRLRQWVEPLRYPASRISLHVIESGSPADTLLDLARANHVDLIVLGAPGPGERKLAWWRSVASTVTASAPCSVHVVRVPERAGAAI